MPAPALSPSVMWDRVQAVLLHGSIRNAAAKTNHSYSQLQHAANMARTAGWLVATARWISSRRQPAA